MSSRALQVPIEALCFSGGLGRPSLEHSSETFRPVCFLTAAINQSLEIRIGHFIRSQTLWRAWQHQQRVALHCCAAERDNSVFSLNVDWKCAFLIRCGRARLLMPAPPRRFRLTPFTQSTLNRINKSPRNPQHILARSLELS